MCLVELKSFLLAFYHISESTAASGMMCEYERTMMLLPMRMRAKAVDELCLDPLQPSAFRYAALHALTMAIARIAAEDNLELLHQDIDTPTTASGGVGRMRKGCPSITRSGWGQDTVI